MEESLREKIVAYYTLQARLDSINKQQNFIVSKISEILSTISSLEELGKSEKTIFSLGSGIRVMGKIEEKNKFLVEIGAGIILEKNLNESKRILEKRREELEKILEELQKEKNEIYSQMQKLLPEIRKLIGD